MMQDHILNQVSIDRWQLYINFPVELLKRRMLGHQGMTIVEVRPAVGGLNVIIHDRERVLRFAHARMSFLKSVYQ